MPKAIRLHEVGGADVMRYEDFDPGAPGEGEVQVRHTAIGLNYIDVYDRSGLYPMPLPAGLGREAAGVVVALGRKVKGFKKGDRVDDLIDEIAAYGDLDASLGHEVHDVFGATIKFGVATLTTEAFDLGDGHAGHADFGQSGADVVELERLDDGGYEFHGEFSEA